MKENKTQDKKVGGGSVISCESFQVSLVSLGCWAATQPDNPIKSVNILKLL